MLKKTKTKYFRRAAMTVLFVAASWSYHDLVYMAPGKHLEIEGILKDHNFRDLGASINSCMQESGLPPVLSEGLIFRSNKWFSGWDCQKVGNPDSIITLNYEPKKDFNYYCTNDNGPDTVGKVFDTQKIIKDIEFLASWKKSEIKETTCSTIKSIYASVASMKRVLFHCEAGRDRTGAVATLLAAAALESAGLNPDQINNLSECDYRKSKSIRSKKYGRMANFLDEIRANSNASSPRPVTDWLQRTCGLSQFETKLALKHFTSQKQLTGLTP